MILIKYAIVIVFLALISGISCGKLKLVAFKGPFGGFIGVKARSPKLLGLKHGLKHGLGGHGGHGGGFGGGYHNEHHEYHHESHYSGGSYGGGFGGGWLGK